MSKTTNTHISSDSRITRDLTSNYLDVKTVCQPWENFMKMAIVCLPNIPYFLWEVHLLLLATSGTHYPHCPHVVLKKVFLSYVSQPLALFIILREETVFRLKHSWINRSARSLLVASASFISIVLNLSYHVLSLPQHLNKKGWVVKGDSKS